MEKCKYFYKHFLIFILKQCKFFLLYNNDKIIHNRAPNIVRLSGSIMSISPILR